MTGERIGQIGFVTVDLLFRVLLEGGVVHPNALGGPECQVGRDGVVRIHVLILHDPTFLVVADRENGKTDISEPGGD